MIMKNYKCKICEKTFDRLVMAEACEKSHTIIYVPLHLADIDRLLQFFLTGDRGLLTRRLWDTLKKIKKANK